MTLPKLDKWKTTCSALHEVVLVVGAIRVASSHPLPNDLQFSVAVTDGGISSTELNIGGELRFDFARFALTYIQDGVVGFTIDVTDHNQQSLMEAVLNQFASLGIKIEPSMKHITHTKTFDVDINLAQDYAIVTNAVYTMLARFRAKLSGCMSPIVIWPHHFDIAFMWFASNGMDEHIDPHLAIGFAPFSDGIDRPYFYGYAWSKDTGYVQVDVESPAKAITDAYTGLFADYDVLNANDNMLKTIERILLAYHKEATKALR